MWAAVLAFYIFYLLHLKSKKEWNLLQVMKMN